MTTTRELHHGRPWLGGILLGCLLGWATASHAQQCPGVTAHQTPFATETLTISVTPTSLTRTVYQPSGVTPTMSVVSIEGGDIRYHEIGTPSATSGHPLPGTPATTVIICGVDSIAGFKAIRMATTDARLTATYYRNRTP